jgi:Protein of unknown function (DUF3306)
MSDGEGFLARWSRRKRGAKTIPPDTEKREGSSGGNAPEALPATCPASPPHPEQLPFDPTSLPPIESIGAGSDIRAFLAPGVPAALARAALRRAWSTDPAIRDFIGLSENSWDFNAPGGVPGFGPVTAEEVRRLLAQAVGDPEAAWPPPRAETAPPGEESPPPSTVPHVAAQNPSQETLERDAGLDTLRQDLPPSGKTPAGGMKGESGGGESPAALPRRGRGGALPK